jgi:Cft2 family RNA processing exonuclease
MSALTIRFHRGSVHLPRLGLWLDAHERQTGTDVVFVSHAHSDHIGAHREVILTAATAKFMQARLKGKREQHLLPFGGKRQFAHGEIPFQITLLPAGHILGSAMALIEAAGESLLYTGDFKLRAGLASEVCLPQPADILIMETTFGLARYQLPASASVWQEVHQFCRAALAEGVTPVLHGYSLGKSQEIMRSVVAAGLPVMVHEQVAAMTRLYEELGENFGAWKTFDPLRARGQVIISPPMGKLGGDFGPVRTAVITGWAMDSSCRYRSGTDAAFPVSDHADHDELLELVSRVKPKRVYTVHGFATEFAETLRQRGIDARALGREEQLGLALDFATDTGQVG